jgi:hypothetical protein
MSMRPAAGDTVRVTTDDGEMHMRVLATEEDLLVLAVPRRARWNMQREGLYVWLPAEDGAWCFAAEREVEEDPETAWIVRLIGEPFHVQRRRYPRIAANFTAVLQVDGRSVPCRVVDHSAGGVRCAVAVGADVREGDQAMLVIDRGEPINGLVLRTQVVGSELHIVLTW